MRIEKTVSIEDQDVSVEVTAEDIAAALLEVDVPRAKYHITGALNNMARFFRAIPPNLLAEFNEHERKLIRDFFMEQAERFAEGK